MLFYNDYSFKCLIFQFPFNKKLLLHHKQTIKERNFLSIRTQIYINKKTMRMNFILNYNSLQNNGNNIKC